MIPTLTPERAAEIARGMEKPIADMTDRELLLAKKADALKDIRIPEIFTSERLLSMEFSPVEWIVPDLIPTGFSLLVGASKLGKSWMSLGLGIGIANGGVVLGSVKVQKHETLMLCLEDTPRRLKNRLDKLHALPSKELHIATQWPRMPKALEHFEKFLTDHPQTDLIFIDTLQMVRGSFEQNYQSDYTEVSAFKQFADHYGISIIALHHTRKMPDGDYLNTVTGSVGIVSAADTVIVLERARGNADAILRATGRDIEEQEKALRFDSMIGSWEIIGDAAEIQKTRERQEIFDALKESREALGPKEIAEALGKRDSGSIRHILRDMVSERVIHQEARGRYLLNMRSQRSHLHNGYDEDGESELVNEVNGVYGRQIL